MQYDYTQERFAAAGIEEIVLFRGQGIKGSTGYRDVIDELQPMSSFSVNLQTALKFGTDVRSGLNESVMVTKVKANQILGSYKTGYGCAEEGEVVVLGGRDLPAHYFIGSGLQEFEAIRRGIETSGGGENDERRR